MKVAIITLAVMAVAVQAAPRDQEKMKWRPAKPVDSSLKFKDMRMDPIRSIFYPKEAQINKFKNQTPKFYSPSTIQQSDCGKENALSDNKVVGGEEATPHQFPWLALVQCISGGWLCTGSVIAEDWVLTAAHCTTGCTEFLITVGLHSRASPDEWAVEITSYEGITHEDYDSFSLINDVGLVKLPEPVEFNDNRRLSCLPPRSSAGNTFADEPSTVTGWGKLSDSSGGAADTVHFYKGIRVMANSECSAIYGETTVDDGCVCIDSVGGHGVCNGDSGGPLNWLNTETGQYWQIGVTSFVSSAGCESGYPHGFRRVTYFLDWIETNTGITIPQ